MLQFSIIEQKFCDYVGQQRCSTLSNYVPSSLALAAIAAVGISATAIIYRNWNATVRSKPVEKKVCEDFPELTGDKLVITALYKEPTTIPIMGANPEWVKADAPYLFGDLRLGNGLKIPLLEGDYVIRLELNDCNKKGDLSRKRYYFLPAILVRRLHPQIPLAIQYKDQQKNLTVSEGYYEALKRTLKEWDRSYYNSQVGSISNDAVVVEPGVVSLGWNGKRYFAPPQ